MHGQLDLTIFVLMNLSLLLCALGRSRPTVIGVESMALGLALFYFVRAGNASAALSAGSELSDDTGPLPAP